MGCTSDLQAVFQGAAKSEHLSMESNLAMGSLNSLSKLERGEAPFASVESEAGTSKKFENISGKSQYYNGISGNSD